MIEKIKKETPEILLISGIFVYSSELTKDVVVNNLSILKKIISSVLNKKSIDLIVDSIKELLAKKENVEDNK